MDCVPLMLLDDAVMMVEPTPVPVRRPVELMLATGGAEEDQLAEFVRSAVLLSL